MVIIYKQVLDEKVNSFIKGNHIIEFKKDPTQKMQRRTQNTKIKKKTYNPYGTTGTQAKSKD
jgi:hypothetical protein